MPRSLRTLAAALAVLTIGLAAPVAAQPYPSRPVVVVAPFAPAGPTDLIGRFVAQRLGAMFGQNFVVENRTGAGGTLGAAVVARAANDGYTLLYGSKSTHAIGPAIYASLPYDAEKSFAPISLVANQALILLVSPSLGVNTIEELIAYGKAHPGKLNYSSAGIGTPSHMNGLILSKRTNIETVHVPYRSGNEAVTALIQGQVQFAFDTLFTSASQIEAGNVKVIAITSDVRSKSIPKVPTLTESVVPGYTWSSWNGLFAPAGTPQPIVETLNGAVRKMLAEKDVQAAFEKYDVEPAGNTPAEFSAFISAEAATWRKLAAELGVKM
jgi:tripartite-type tricarboxylate transporter receptor subunit TctC